jgi:hypothetical protein
VAVQRQRETGEEPKKQPRPKGRFAQDPRLLALRDELRRQKSAGG